MSGWYPAMVNRSPNLARVGWPRAQLLYTFPRLARFNCAFVTLGAFGFRLGELKALPFTLEPATERLAKEGCWQSASFSEWASYLLRHLLKLVGMLVPLTFRCKIRVRGRSASRSDRRQIFICQRHAKDGGTKAVSWNRQRLSQSYDLASTKVTRHLVKR